MDTQTIVDNENFHKEFEAANGFRRKDVTPHHIPNTNLRLGEFTTDTAIRGKDVAPHHIRVIADGEAIDIADEEPISRLLARADASLVSTDSGSYLRDLGVSTADLVDRLRHRATLMRQRADEFDTMADLHEGASYQSVRSSIERHDELSQEIEALLKRHAHVNPTAVRT